MCVIFNTFSALIGDCNRLRYKYIIQFTVSDIHPCSPSAPEGGLLRVGSSSTSSVHLESFEHHSVG